MSKKPLAPDLSAIDPEEIEIQETAVADIAGTRYAEFLVHSNERSVPDIRDGMIHSHRRILIGFRDNAAHATSRHFKSVKIVGDVLGRYHPHGDGAVYAAAVGMSQDWKTRYPLIDFQGNNGSIDGDGAAAYRYTEMRPSHVGDELLRDLENRAAGIVPWGGNFTNEHDEPYILPARFPHLIANGHYGIGTGFSSTWLPHNLREVIDAITAVIDNPKIADKAIGKYIKGPDFPTGGIVVGTEGFDQALTAGGTSETGRGTVVIRGRVGVEEDGKETRLVVTEIPWMVDKSSIIEEIVTAVANKKIEGIADVSDQSGQDWKKDARLVMTLKRDARPAVVIAQLYKYSSLEYSRLSYNMMAYVEGYPERLTIKDAIDHFIAHQIDVLTKRTQHRKRKAEEALEVQEAYLLADKYADELVPIAKKSANRAALEIAIPKLIKGATTRQCEVIAGMPLYRFSKIDTDGVKTRIAELKSEIAAYVALIGSKQAMRDLLKDELREIRTKHGDDRRTEIMAQAPAGEDLQSIDDLIPDEPCWVALSSGGLISRLPAATFKAQKRGGAGVNASREDDPITQVASGSTRSKVWFVTDKGNLFGMRANDIEEAARGGRGQSIRRHFSGMSAEEKVVRIVVPPLDLSAGEIVIATAKGKIKRTAIAEYANLTAGGLRTIVVGDGDAIVAAFVVSPETMDFVVVTSDGYTARYDIGEVSVQGRVAQGVTSIKLNTTATVVATFPVAPKDGRDLLIVATSGKGKRTKLAEYPQKGRGIRGVTGVAIGIGAQVAMAAPVSESDLVLLVSTGGKAVATEASEIRRAGRATAGVGCMALSSGEKVAVGSVAPVPPAK
jgi:DNA gyrase subunit A